MPGKYIGTSALPHIESTLKGIDVVLWFIKYTIFEIKIPVIFRSPRIKIGVFHLPAQFG